MSAFVRAPPGGHLTTFYSYKGGVGRTALLANVAFLLASWGRKVLCLDWDLEAPGLKRYLERGDDEKNDGPGVLDLILGSLNGEKADWRSMRRDITGPWQSGSGQLHFIDAGRHRSDSERYITEVLRLDFYAMAQQGLGTALEVLREEWLGEYDHVLIDSRTGITDVGGICAAQLPDLLVLCVNMNAQSIEGAAMLARMAKQLRSSLAVYRGVFQVLPVPCKVTVDMESKLEQRWQGRFVETLGDHLRRALPPAPDRDLLPALFPQLRVPWAPRWAHGEELAVLEERLDDLGSTAWGMANIAALVDTQLLHIGALLDQPDLLRPEGGPASRGELIARLANGSARNGDPMAALGERARLTTDLKRLVEANSGRQGGLSPHHPPAVLRTLLDPTTLRASSAGLVAEIVLEAILDKPSVLDGWFDAAGHLVEHWLAAGVSLSAADNGALTLSSAGWNPENPALSEAWAKVAELCLVLVRAAPERGWQVVRTLGKDPTVGLPKVPPALSAVLEGLLRALVGELPPVAAPVERATAEDALLVAALQPWCPPAVAAEVLRARAADPRFLAWRCAHDPTYVVLDPEAAAEQVLAEGQAVWWRSQITDRRDIFTTAPPRLLVSLVALRLEPSALGELLNTLPEGNGQAGAALVSGWAALQPEPFAALLKGSAWMALSPLTRRRVLAAGWSSAASPLAEGIRAAARAAGGAAQPGPGLAAELWALRDAPADLPDDQAAILVIALEQATSGEGEAADLLLLAAHPGRQTRAAVDEWAFRAARAGRLHTEDLRALALRLTEAPARLDGVASLLLLRPRVSAVEHAEWATIEQVVMQRLSEWVALPNAVEALGRSAWQVDACFIRLMNEQPAVWWGWAELRVSASGHSSELVKGAPADALEAAIDAAPGRLQRMSPAARVYDQLVRALPGPRFLARSAAAIEAEDLGQAQRLLLARGLASEHFDLLEHIVEAADPMSDEALTEWGRRLLRLEGNRGYRTIGFMALPQDRDFADLLPEERDPQGAALRAAVEARSEVAPSRRARRFYAEVLRRAE
jgi:cellulose biosynthesis protein BcsQ